MAMAANFQFITVNAAEMYLSLMMSIFIVCLTMGL